MDEESEEIEFIFEPDPQLQAEIDEAQDAKFRCRDLWLQSFSYRHDLTLDVELSLEYADWVVTAFKQRIKDGFL